METWSTSSASKFLYIDSVPTYFHFQLRGITATLSLQDKSHLHVWSEVYPFASLILSIIVQNFLKITKLTSPQNLSPEPANTYKSSQLNKEQEKRETEKERK